MTFGHRKDWNPFLLAHSPPIATMLNKGSPDSMKYVNGNGDVGWPREG
jgi:hypothetical protein